MFDVRLTYYLLDIQENEKEHDNLFAFFSEEYDVTKCMYTHLFRYILFSTRYMTNTSK